MLPLILSQQVQKGLEDYIRTTFPPSNAPFAGMMDGLFADKENPGASFFQGPYISLGLPFRLGDVEENHLKVMPDWRPHRHQQLSWMRMAGDRPKSTLIATGTGSGKTECFLYPIFDYCRRHAGEPGIKAILIYPMNALATDQAKRIARITNEDKRLHSRVTAGLFIGDDKTTQKYAVMQDSMVITDRDAILENPPDILLTNYKMLDLLLLRQRYFSLFAQNNATALRFLVVDEIHTFDGAQGSDLACLFRRIKHRLNTPENHLCCVGTSATAGESDGHLAKYAEEIFGENFDEDSVIGEDRLSAEEYLAEKTKDSNSTGSFPRLPAFKDLPYDGTMGGEEYFLETLKRWFSKDYAALSSQEGASELGRRLCASPAFQRLLRSFGSTLFTFEDAVADYRDYLGLEDGQLPAIRNMMASLLSLISMAREERADGGTKPFLRVRVQLWGRELRRMVAPIISKPKLLFSDDRTVEESDIRKALPVVHCRDCGTVGWVSYRTKTNQSGRFQDDLREIYSRYFGRSDNIHFLYPMDAPELGGGDRLCAECLYHMGGGEKKCPSCGASENKLICVKVTNPTRTSQKTHHSYGSHDCPWCNSYESLTIVGSQAASLNAVALSQLFASPHNDDKKAIAFSDSVQDAGHRAGFFGARTSQFNLRMAIRQLLEGKDAVPLAQLKEDFHHHYRSTLGAANYFATFLAPGIRWIPEVFVILMNEKPPSDADIEKAAAVVHRRLNWDITVELGHRAMIGRTLEKSFAVACTAPKESFDKAAQKLTQGLWESIGGLQNLEEQTVRWFLQGFLRHIRHRGAVLTPQTEPYVKEQGKPFLLGGPPGSPDHDVIPHGMHLRHPAFLAPWGDRYQRFDNLPRRSGDEQTWYALWGRKLFQGNVDDYLSDVYDAAVEELLNAGILKEIRTTKDNPVWGLDEAALLVSTKTTSLSCDATGCGEMVSVPSDEIESWDGMPCPARRCPGRLREDKAYRSEDYYRRMYETGSIGRIIPAEHTGLLSRKARESVERDFINGTHPWSPNVLSATPTLELGIDIGDLSSVILCSVPPTVANYLQRIGRAGRKDGNAFVFTTATGRPHDNAFFNAPQLMMNGKVETPGLFLDAPKVLERQFLAFMLDTWLHGEGSALPESVRTALEGLQSGSKNEFPRTLRRYLESHGRKVVDDFFASFGDLVSPMVREELSTNLLIGENTVYATLTDALRREERERNGLESRIRALTPRIRHLEKLRVRDKKEEEELEDLKNEKRALERFIKMINKKSFLEFLTDEGLLPNYMFPESGITLKSVILKERSRAQRDAHEKRPIEEFEYVRPSAMAITELAPENHFYAGGIQAEIDQIDLHASEIEEWRLCDRCHHTAPKEGEEALGACPRCGSLGWRNVTSIRKMIRLRQVTATVLERKSLVQDDSDDRKRLFYESRKLIEIPPNQVLKAFRVSGEGRAFGFELIPRVDIREVNFGNKENSGPAFQVAGMSIETQGFAVCTQCGKVSTPKEERHAPYCPVKNGGGGSQPSDNNPIENGVYLYRDFSSEAVRILLPFDVSVENTTRESFVAGFFLGLKKYWAGKIDHIRATDMIEPDSTGRSTKDFLVLYDTVPGGTGYLKQLMNDSMSLFSVMEKARTAMTQCECVDGCYSCLFAYSNQQNRNFISKREAVTVLSDLLDLQSSIEETDSLTALDMTDFMDSELEARFVEALRRYGSSKSRKIKVKNVYNQRHGKTAFQVNVENQTWDVIPQVDLGREHGVSVPCRPDFLMERRKLGTGGVAVFTDGYRFHADPKINRLGDDVRKRNALHDSKQYRVWCLSWDDVDSIIQGKEPRKVLEEITDAKLWMKYAKSTKECTPELKAIREMGSMDMLLHYMEFPEAPRWKAVGFGAAACLKGDAPRSPAPEDPLPLGSAKEEVTFVKHLETPRLRTWAFLQKGGTAQDCSTATSVTLEFDDKADFDDESEYKTAWNDWLGMMNVWQFLEQKSFRTVGWAEDERVEHEVIDPDLSSILDLIFDDAAANYIQRRCTKGDSQPIPGYEICDANGVVLLQTEAAWPETKECLLMENENRGTAEDAGWTVIVPTEGAENE